MTDSREKILQRVEEALADRPARDHPGPFPGGPFHSQGTVSPVERFRRSLEAAGGELLVFSGSEDARSWLQGFAQEFDAASFGETVPDSLRIEMDRAKPAGAGLGVSMARCAIAETGSLVLDARDGRRTQLLPPTHVVWVRADTVYGTVLEFLQALSGEPLPSALGLHSGPSKSADIGQIMVQGIHGPGRLIAAIID
ncbi:MAG: LUD domain-containing protein [Gemmatimonadota bacterium]|jgi:L-lactate dehydrogenase complex protein LldG